MDLLWELAGSREAGLNAVYITATATALGWRAGSGRGCWRRTATGRALCSGGRLHGGLLRLPKCGSFAGGREAGLNAVAENNRHSNRSRVAGGI
jgi:hypothetical protein